MEFGFLLKSPPEDLRLLTKRMATASEDLRKDTAEIQYLLSRIQDSIEGESIPLMIDGSMKEIDHCNELSKRLKEFSDDLRKISALYLKAETDMAEAMANVIRKDITG